MSDATTMAPLVTAAGGAGSAGTSPAAAQPHHPMGPRVRLAQENPPGQRQLHFRAGTYQSFLQQMLAELPRRVVLVDGQVVRPLEVLDPVSSRDFSWALLDAWATVGDVLTFYQERLLNEGFLRTAVEGRSVRELTAQLGFPLEPGVAASTWLGFGVSSAPGAPDGIRIPTGTAAQSIPGTNETPQTFEVSTQITARPAWNAVSPAPVFTTQAQSLAVTDTQARLTGTGTGLALGAPLLAAAADGSAWSFGTVTSVEPNAQARETRVTWAPAGAGTHGAGAMASPSVWAFGRTTRLFGYNAAQWSALTTEQKRQYREILGGVFVLAGAGGDWVGASGGLPASDVRALAVDEAGRIYAGTAGAGLFASADAGLTWSAGGPRYADVYSLAAGSNARVYAGLSGGRVYRTCDGGASWDSVSGTTTITTGKKPTDVVVTRLPAAPIRALFDDGEGTLYAGTDFGAYRSADTNPAWSPVHALDSGDLKDEREELAAGAASPPASAPQPAVWCFARTAWDDVAMGTDAGVWSVVTGYAVGKGLPAHTPDGQPNVVRALTADGTALLAGTDAGLFTLHHPGFVQELLREHGHWAAAPGPESGGAPLPVRALVHTSLGLLAATPAGVYRRDSRGAWSLVGTEGMPDAGSPPLSPPGDCGQPIPVPAPAGLNQPDVTTLAAGAGVVVAASPYAGFPVEEWPGPPICDDVVYLAGVIPQVVPGSWLVLQQGPDPAGGGPAAAVAVCRVASVRTLTLQRYGRQGQATEVKVDPVPGLEVFDLRATSAYAASRALSLVSSRLPDLVPFAGSKLRLNAALPALAAGRAVSVNGRRIRAVVWPRAGVFVTAKDGKKGWTPAGLASVDVVAVTWGPGGMVLAAVGGAPGDAGPAAGLYASKDGGKSWTQLTSVPGSGVPVSLRVHALAYGGGAIWAAGADGAVYTSADAVRWSGAGKAGKAVTALAVSASGAVHAATANAGVLRRGTDGAWTPAGTGLPTGAVRALAIAPDGGVAAATGRGVWWLAAGAAAWTSLSGGEGNNGLGNLDVRAVAVLPSGELLAGTGGGGVFSAAAAGEPWEAAYAGLDLPGSWTVTALAADAAGNAWAGTRGAGCFTRAAGETAWSAAALGAANDVRALAAGPGGAIAGCGAVPLLVANGATRATLGLQPLLSVSASYAADLDRGSLSAALLKSLTDAGITFSATSPPVVRTQTAGEAWWIDATDGVLLLRLDAGAIRVRQPRALATLMGPPPTSPAGVLVADAGGNLGTVTPRAAELLWQPADSGTGALGEVALVAATAGTGLKTTLLTLQAPLSAAYDPATVKVCGNLAAATQGATQGAWPRPEVLGSGNASLPGQSFTLARAPLTFVPADTPSGVASTLQVWVNGVQWTEVDTLFGQPPDAAAFVVTVDETGAGTVTFGDGVNGARLPTGTGNVTAQYRVGIGPSGNVGSGRVTLLRSAPLGVRSVTNPVAAGGGAQGETTAEAAATTPLRARVLERVVGLQDFRDYALSFPGISKAVAQPLRDRRGRAVVAVTVAGGRGGPEEPDPELLDELTNAMLAAGAHGRFQVLAYDPLALVVKARVETDPRYHAAAVAAAAAAALSAEYAPDRRGLGEGAAASRAVAVLQGVPGVVGVELQAFYLSGATPAVETYLDALGARVDPRGDAVLAAQLLLPASPGGITVTAQEAS